MLSLVAVAAAQDVIPLYPGIAPGSTQQNYPEKQYYSTVWHTDVVTNVTQPTLTVFKPSLALKNGTAIVICPGGGFMALSIASEGTDVAKYLAARGVTAFVLKYRVAHTGEDATQEFMTLYADKQKFDETVKSVEPLAVADGLAAVTYVRQHAPEWGISPDRVGIIGFSAGGFVTAEVALHYSPQGRPAFVAPIYGGLVERRSRPRRRTAHVYCGGYRRFTRSRASKALPFIRSGRPLRNRLNCTCTPRAATASGCACRTFPQISGSTGLPIGCNSKAF